VIHRHLEGVRGHSKTLRDVVGARRGRSRSIRPEALGPGEAATAPEPWTGRGSSRRSVVTCGWIGKEDEAREPNARCCD
jgi:hypothetical protein